MKNALIGIALVVSVIVVGTLFSRDTGPEAPSDEPVADKVLTVSPGKILEKDALGNINLLPNANFNGNLSLDDLNKSIEAADVEAGSGLAFSRGQVDHEGEEVIQNLISFTNQDFLYVFDYTLATGRFFENEESEKVAVVGQSLKTELEEKGAEVLGATLDVRGQKHKIIGILDPINTGNPSADADWNKLLLIPFSQSSDIFETELWVEEIRLVATSTKKIDSAARNVSSLLIKQRGAEDFTVLTPADVQAIDELLQR